ncbi:TFIIB-type zinc ribbon-containing protein [Paenibacillus endoradicis]|uniref:TFIIB-type zinc ribbon-containing protein n=1 Tax=Paenibacillus endoradicis TaxID=2972487 RepID=UPI00280C2FF2|nr:zf-TFIIB domain-containing protein [Paenibacillus endoradicis]
MKCPVCDQVTLREVEKSGVLIDICPSCKGVWLDRGELEKLMQSINETQEEFEQLQSQVATQHLRTSMDQSYNPNEQKANQQPFTQQPYSQQTFGNVQQNYQQANHQQPNYQQSNYEQPYNKDSHKHGDSKYGYDKYGRPYKKKKKTVFSVFEDLFD